jgi:hypothetical protein
MALVLGPFLSQCGFRVWVDPDGSDYFDMIVQRGDELGLIELKVSDWKRVLVQAVERRAWADWVAVAVPRRSLTKRLLARSTGPVSQRVGILVLDQGHVEVLRPATACGPADLSRPPPELRARLVELLAVSSAEGVGTPIQWSLPIRRRQVGALRLEEFPESG